MATLAEAAVIARSILAEFTHLDYKYADDRLLTPGNNAIKAIAIARPELFKVVGEIACIVNSVEQTLNPADGSSLVDIHRIKNGAVVDKADRMVMDRFKPGWAFEAAGPARNWMSYQDDPMRFSIYPQAPSGQVLVGYYVLSPVTYTTSQTIILPATYLLPIAHYMCSETLLRGDDASLHPKASVFMAMFNNAMGVSDKENDKRVGV